MTAARFWRARALANGGNGVVSASRVSLKDGTDQDIGLVANSPGVTYISGTTFGGFPASAAFDSNPSTAWAATTGPGDANSWVGVDLGVGVTKEVQSIESVTRTDASNDQGVTQWVVERSDDGVAWVQEFETVNVGGPTYLTGTVSALNLNQTIEWRSLAREAVGTTATFWRLLLETRPGSNAYTYAEIEFISAGGVNQGPFYPTHADNVAFNLGPAALDDGNLGSIWAGDGTPGIIHARTQADKIEIGFLRLTARNDGLAASQTADSWRLQKSNGEGWTDVLVTTGDTGYTASEERLFSVSGGPLPGPSSTELDQTSLEVIFTGTPATDLDSLFLETLHSVEPEIEVDTVFFEILHTIAPKIKKGEVHATIDHAIDPDSPNYAELDTLLTSPFA